MNPEILTVSENVTILIATSGLVTHDTISITESVSFLFNPKTSSVAETITLTEGVTMRSKMNPLVFEAVTVTDVPTINILRTAFITEAVTVTDVPTLTRVDGAGMFGEAVAVAEDITISVSAPTNIFFDSVTVTDVATIVVNTEIGARTSILRNGSFRDGTNHWNIAGGWMAGPNKIVSDGLSNGTIFQGIPNMRFNQPYTLSFTVQDYVSGTGSVTYGAGGPLDPTDSFSGDGDYSFTFYADGISSYFCPSFHNTGTWIGSITTISVIPVDWNDMYERISVSDGPGYEYIHASDGTFYGTVSSPGPNYTNSNLSYGGWGDAYYSFHHFDTSNVPFGDVITFAEVDIYINGPSVNDAGLQVFPITSSWDKTTLTSSLNPIVDPSARGDVFAPDTTNLGYSHATNMTGMVQDWRNDELRQEGVSIRPQNTSDQNNGTYSNVNSTGDPLLFVQTSFFDGNPNPSFVISTLLIEVSDDIFVEEEFRSPVASFTVFEEVFLEDAWTQSTFQGFQMPLSRPQGSSVFDYSQAGSSLPGTGLSAGGGL